MDKHSFFESVLNFFKKHTKIDIKQIDSDTDFIKSGIVDSLLLTEFIIFIEDLLNIDINIDEFEIAKFNTIDNVYKNYVLENE